MRRLVMWAITVVVTLGSAMFVYAITISLQEGLAAVKEDSGRDAIAVGGSSIPELCGRHGPTTVRSNSLTATCSSREERHPEEHGKFVIQREVLSVTERYGQRAIFPLRVPCSRMATCS